MRPSEGLPSPFLKHAQINNDHNNADSRDDHTDAPVASAEGETRASTPDGSELEFNKGCPYHPKDCLCYQEQSQMIDEHEKHMQEREMEIEGLYANVKLERRQLNQLREELMEQKSAQPKWFEDYSARMAGRETEMAKLCASVEAERFGLSQLIQQFDQQKQAHAELVGKHEARMAEADRLFERVKDLWQIRESSAQQVACLVDVFNSIYHFVDSRKRQV